MSKRTSFVGFLTLTLSISLLALACSKKQDANEPPPPPDNNTSSESNSPGTNTSSEPECPAPQEPPSAGRITEQNVADSNKPELTKTEPDYQTPAGLILAIAYSNRPAVLIEDQLLSEGDTIRGVKVIKISEGIVEFEKDGQRWTQQAGETPPAHWSDPNS